MDHSLLLNLSFHKKLRNNVIYMINAAFGTGRNYRKSEFRLVNFVCPISFLVFPSRHVGREIPRPSCEYSGLDLAEQRKSTQKYLHFFLCFSVFIKILLSSNKITSYCKIIQFECPALLDLRPYMFQCTKLS